MFYGYSVYFIASLFLIIGKKKAKFSCSFDFRFVYEVTLSESLHFKCDQLDDLEDSLRRLTINVDQIVTRVKTRTGIRNLIHCIRPRRRTINKEIVINACKVESALNALRLTVASARESASPELIELAKEQELELDSLISAIEAILNF